MLDSNFGNYYMEDFMLTADGMFDVCSALDDEPFGARWDECSMHSQPEGSSLGTYPRGSLLEH